MHLIIDGYGADPGLLQDEAAIYQFLDTYPERIGMTKISPPHVFRYVGSKPEDWGISGFVIIAESHIAIHTFVERGLVNIDVFSCKAFDAQHVIDCFRDRFRLSRVNTFILRRGLEYPGPEQEGIPVFEPALSAGLSAMGRRTADLSARSLRRSPESFEPTLRSDRTPSEGMSPPGGEG